MNNQFEQYRGDIAIAVADAVSIAWDGCHKIYVHMDEEQHDTAVGYGYDPIQVTDRDEAVETLRKWYDASCGLKFITKISTVKGGDPNAGFVDLIPQFAE